MATQKIRSGPIRIPSHEEYEAFDGAHCKNLYAGLPPQWSCPGCGRSRYQIMRWTVIYPKRPDRHEGWAGGLHTHHDHGGDVPGRFFGGPAARFQPVVICEQCNSADGTAKRKLGLPSQFSFAPWEIRQFVEATPHGFHVIDYSKAELIYRQLFNLPSSA